MSLTKNSPGVIPMDKIQAVLSGFFSELGGVLSGFDSVSDVLDVLLVALIIYALIIQLRKTQSVQIIKGIALLVVVYIIVFLAKMQTSKLIFDYLINDILLIFVIIFGTEIRQALEKMGQSRFKNFFSFSQKSDTTLTDTINATVRACSSMSDDKMGSLIVFKRFSNLGELERSGVAIDAKVTTEMLCSIFYPKAALHDGAIIIDYDRIIAARCIVSLKNDIVVHDKVGTRHRAALEVSRSTDAVVVVTSEESGLISIAVDGNLIRGISDSELRQQLIKYLMPQQNTPSTVSKKLKKMLKKGGNKNGDERSKQNKGSEASEKED